MADGTSSPPSPSETCAAVDDSSPASRTGIWVGMAAITMTFVAFTSAMIVRQGSSLDWRHFALPWVLYLDTAILLASSARWSLRASGSRPLCTGHADDATAGARCGCG